MVFQEPMSALSPVHTIGDQIAESVLLHDAQKGSRRTRRASSGGNCRSHAPEGRYPRSGFKDEALSARTQRRHASTSGHRPRTCM
jgi:peptide/nickel transport system ATP-binding protein